MTLRDEAASRRRVLLDLHHATANRQSIEAGADLARLLGRELLGVFVEDAAVLGLAAMPFARELRLPAHAWSALEPEQIAAEFNAAADRVRRMLDEHCARLGIPGSFEILRGDPAGCVAALCRATDILVLRDADSAAERAFGGFSRAWTAALDSAASVLLLPSRIARQSGPVVVVVGDGYGGLPELAPRIAHAAQEKLLLLVTPDATAEAEALARAAREAGLAADQVAIRPIPSGAAEAILAALEGHGERLLVLERSAAPDRPPFLAAMRRVPVLIG